MAISVKAAIKELQTRDRFFVAYSQATKLPYVTCDEETFNDQVWVFSTEEEIKAFGEEKLKEKILLMGMGYLKKDFPRFFGTLYAIGVNSVVWNKNGERVEVELEKIARQQDFSKLEPAKRPLLNPTLQLSGIYFMQELRRPIPLEEKENIAELEEELLVNLSKADVLMAMDVDPKDPKKMNVPYLKDKDGKVLHPVYTDVLEFEKFAKGKKFRVIKVPFTKLPEIMIKQADAVVINPMGMNLPLNREQLKNIIG